MTTRKPSRLLEQSLLFVLKGRDRETISGDLLEEFRDEQLPRLGSQRAHFWYFRQVLGFAFHRLFNRPWLDRSVTALCFFTFTAALWLIAMETILKHDGHMQRSVVAFCFAFQSMATLLWLIDNLRLLRPFITMGSLVILCVGASALRNATAAGHFEGFAVIIAGAIVSQSFLTFVALYVKHQPGEPDKLA